MKRILWVIGLIVVVLVTVVTGCTTRYDSRLIEADNLMQSNPDSALALVEAVTPADLATEGDRAYRDLLLTQARYKCYITATSDSNINRALDYYRQHKNEREKLTRALIYKGAVMEELGHPDSAMRYYKQAEATADDHDYANLGQVNTRIASLYRQYFMDATTCYDRYKQALHYHQLTSNKHQQQLCLFNMAACNAISKNGDAIGLLEESFDLANELNDSSSCFKCKELLCRQLLMSDSTLNAAKETAQQCLSVYGRFVNYDLLLDLASIYVKQEMLDSALFYLQHVDERLSADNFAQVKVRKYLLLSKIADRQGDQAKSKLYGDLSRYVTDSINNSRSKYELQMIDHTIEHQQTETKAQERRTLSSQVSTLSIVLSLALMALAVFIFYHFSQRRYLQSLIYELKTDTKGRIDNHEPLLGKIDAQYALIDHYVKNLVSFMQLSIDASENDSPKVIRGRIKTMVQDVTNDDFWNQLRDYLDRNHHNIITRIAQNPHIKKKDLRFIELMCCDFNYLEIAVTLKLAPKYISEKRQEIAKKLGINMPLQEYLKNEMNQ